MWSLKVILRAMCGLFLGHWWGAWYLRPWNQWYRKCRVCGQEHASDWMRVPVSDCDDDED